MLNGAPTLVDPTSTDSSIISISWRVPQCLEIILLWISKRLVVQVRRVVILRSVSVHRGGHGVEREARLEGQ
jgi:hypothetical protein